MTIDPDIPPPDLIATSEERWRITFDAARLGTWDWNLQTGQVIWNQWHFHLFGLQTDGKPRDFEAFAASIHPDDRERTGAIVLDAVARTGHFETEFRVVWPDGTVHWIAGTGRVTERDEAGQATRMNGVVRDISAHKEAEAALQQLHHELESRIAQRTAELDGAVQHLSQEVEQRRCAEAAQGRLMAQLVNAQEEERHRLSRELHDQMGQTLTAILMNIEALEGAALPVALQTRRDRARELTRELVEQIHRMSWELRPAALDNVGLEAAMQQLGAEWSHLSGVACDVVTSGFQSSDPARLPAHLKIVFYRVAQEALTNVARHAGASRVSVVLEKTVTQIRLIVEDNGRGFAPDKMAEGRLGLVGMRERLDGVGGTWEIESNIGDGTTIYARAPLE